MAGRMKSLGLIWFKRLDSSISDERVKKHTRLIRGLQSLIRITSLNDVETSMWFDGAARNVATYQVCSALCTKPCQEISIALLPETPSAPPQSGSFIIEEGRCDAPLPLVFLTLTLILMFSLL